MYVCASSRSSSPFNFELTVRLSNRAEDVWPRFV